MDCAVFEVICVIIGLHRKDEQMSTNAEPIQIQLSEEQQKRLQRVLHESNQDQDVVIQQAIDQYIDLYEWQKEKIQQRLAKANSPDAIFHNSSDVEKMIESWN
jgi:predicted transcriptional regulator